LRDANRKRVQFAAQDTIGRTAAGSSCSRVAPPDARPEVDSPEGQDCGLGAAWPP